MDESIGPFRVLREIGRGQNAVVYEAHDTRRDEVVALKVLQIAEPARTARDAPGHGDAAILRFVREADAIRRLAHPNIVRIRDAGAETGKLYIAMERLHGETLRSRLAQGPIPMQESVKVALQVATALVSAHERGITHRDVKPDNIYLLPDGTAKLMDFGAARVTGEHSLTQTGSVIGSPAYMAPEQVAGGETDGRTDVWGLAATLFEAVTGSKPFSGDSVASVMYGILHKRPDFARVPSPALAQVLEKALSKKPAARHPGVAAFAAQLRSLPASAGERPAPRRGWSPARPAVLTGAAAAAGLLVLGFLLRPDAAPDRPAPSVPVLDAPPEVLAANKAPQAPAPVDVQVQEKIRKKPQNRPEVPRKSPAAPPATAKQALPPKPKAKKALPASTGPAEPARGKPAGVKVASAAKTPLVFSAPPRPARRPPTDGDEAGRDAPPPRQDPGPPTQASGAEDKDAEPNFSPPPVLPASLKGFVGEVWLRVRVNEDGVVRWVEVMRSSGEPGADRAAEQAVRGWEFSPALREGRAVATAVEMTVSFGDGP